ncbi:MAG: LLM class flavin-dependent oxidoreductase, partial [Pseudomonadota bacterium]
ELPPLEIYAGGSVAVGTGLEAQRNMARPQVALYVGGMGAKEKNFYNQIFRKYGFEEEAEIIQELYLSGRKGEAERVVPQEYIDSTSLIGDESFIKDRLQVYQEAGVTCLSARFLGKTIEERVKHCDALRNIIEKI